MSAEEPTIPEEPVAEPAQPAATEPAEPAATEPAEPAEPAPKRGRGRPAGSKDKAPRAKPRVRAEPLVPKPAEPAEVPPPSAAGSSQAPETRPVEPVEARPPSPEPLTPRTLYRQTSAHLLTLRDLVQTQKRASVADRYTARLHAWPVV